MMDKNTLEIKQLDEYIQAVSEHTPVRTGVALPFGAHTFGHGVNFSVFSRHATHVRLELFAHPDDKSPTQAFDLDPHNNRTGDLWHIWIAGIKPGQLYGYRMDGPYQPSQGFRFNFNKLLIDPYAKAIHPPEHWDFHTAHGYDLSTGQDLPSTLDDTECMPKCVFTHDHFHWKNDKPLHYPWPHLIIYETHVRGFTCHQSSEVSHPGTYRGLIEKIPYLQDLGITAIELMPVHQFNNIEVIGINPTNNQPLTNYWGYDPVSFFAPHAAYSSCGAQGQQVLEFKEMVLAFHKAGIEVILDIVFNHTAEGQELGPTFSFRGMDNHVFYILDSDKTHYKNYTGTGNTINANHPIVRDHLLETLRYWVLGMHIDGFRFDLASILDRDENGNIETNSPLLERIAEDPILQGVKLIAEPWDITGVSSHEHFSGMRFSEWNGLYRDQIRQFWRGDKNMLGSFATRITGSADIFGPFAEGPTHSINFLTCHDGFTLNDLVSYCQKHNHMNGENNRDGLDENFSNNYGVEGQSDDPVIDGLRTRQIKNFLLTLFISRGIPMILGGDEFRRTQSGNNNAYCQDNEISWYDWTRLEKYREIHQFTKKMIEFRKNHPILSQEFFYTGEDLQWFDPYNQEPIWSDPNKQELACLIQENEHSKLYFMFNASTEDISFTLPLLPETWIWSMIIDTAQGVNDTLHKISDTYFVIHRASVILHAHPLSYKTMEES